MATNPLRPLGSFQKLSPQVYYLAPTPKDASPAASASANGIVHGNGSLAHSVPGPDESPELILLFTWMGAQPKHIAKYAAAYHALYPPAGMLVITTNVVDVALRPGFLLRRRLAPAVRIATMAPSPSSTSSSSSPSSSPPRLLVSCFSNGGAFALLSFARQHLSQTGSRFAPSALVLDSTPSRGDYPRSIAAIMAAAPPLPPLLRLLLLAAAHALLTFLWAFYRFVCTELVTRRGYRELNRGVLLPLRGLPRAYLYSKTDRLVWWRDVESHAHDVREKAGPRTPVELCCFERSGHVDHFRVDPDRYLAAVRRCWDSRLELALVDAS